MTLSLLSSTDNAPFIALYRLDNLPQITFANKLNSRLEGKGAFQNRCEMTGYELNKEGWSPIFLSI